MRCEDVAARSADGLAGALGPDEADELRKHLAACARCAADEDALDRLWALLGRVPALEPDSARLRATFGAALDEHDAVSRSRRTMAASDAATRFGRRVLFPAAAAALLVTGVVIGRATVPDVAPETDIAALRQELRELRVMVGVSLLQQPSASERLRGVSWSGQVEEPGNELALALLDTLMHDPNDNVRLAAVDALRRYADRDVVRQRTLEALPRQTSPLVQIAIIDFAVESDDRTAVEPLRRLAADPAVNEAVRARAERAAQQLG